MLIGAGKEKRKISIEKKKGNIDEQKKKKTNVFSGENYGRKKKKIKIYTPKTW